MWGGVSGVPQPAGMYAGATFNQSMQPQQAAAAAPAQKHDIFVGNLSFNTTEEQIQQAFSEIGKVINVWLVSDLETGKPRG
jgi:RNA recognition motif-containing protein